MFFGELINKAFKGYVYYGNTTLTSKCISTYTVCISQLDRFKSVVTRRLLAALATLGYNGKQFPHNEFEG